MRLHCHRAVAAKARRTGASYARAAHFAASSVALDTLAHVLVRARDGNDPAVGKDDFGDSIAEVLKSLHLHNVSHVKQRAPRARFKLDEQGRRFQLEKGIDDCQRGRGPFGAIAGAGLPNSAHQTLERQIGGASGHGVIAQVD